MIWGSTILHPYLIPIFLVVICRQSCYFKDILKIWIFRLRMPYNFFQVWDRLSHRLIKCKLKCMQLKTKSPLMNPRFDELVHLYIDNVNRVCFCVNYFSLSVDNFHWIKKCILQKLFGNANSTLVDIFPDPALHF